MTAIAIQPSTARFAIRYGRTDIWMNQHGDLGSRALCALFRTAGEAQAFLDSRRLRRGMRPQMMVEPIGADDIRAMADEVADCLLAARRHGASLQDQLMWNARFAQLTNLLPEPVAA